MPDQGLMADLGIKLSDVVAGFAGGIVNALAFRKTDPFSMVGSIVVGTLTAAYLADYPSKWFGTSGNASAFIVGLAGMAICQGIVASVKKLSAGGSNGQGAGSA